IQALVDNKKVIITDTSVRSDLQLEDAKGTECIPNAIIFEQLTLMGYENLTQKLTFYKAFFSPQWKFLIHTILQCLSAKTTAWNEFSSTMASAIICLATNQKFNFSKYIFDNMVKNLEGGVKFLMYPRFVQVFLDKQVEGMSKHKEIYVTPSHTKKVFANMKREGKGFSGRVTPLFETMMVQAPEELVLDLENTKTSQAVEIAKLKEKVKKLERRSLGAQKDASKQGRKIADLSTAEVTTAIATTKTVDELTLAQTLIEIKAAKPKAVTTAATTTTIAITRSKVDSFVPMDTEVVEGSKSLAEGSKKRTREELESDNSKKQKIDENVEIEVDDKAEMKKLREIVLDDEFQIIRAAGSSKRYSSMTRMLQNINREDMETLWKLVKAKHRNTRLEEAYEKVLWGDLKVMFEPDLESEVWRNVQ
ncbi:hypothetical protein Tco_1372821, partial [Tanacetum coccineum]